MQAFSAVTAHPEKASSYFVTAKVTLAARIQMQLGCPCNFFQTDHC